MSEQSKTPQPGEWWETGTGSRVFIIGWTFGSSVVYQDHSLRLQTATDGIIHKWVHLPDCTGWTWRAPKTIDPGVGYRLIDKDVDQWQEGDHYYSVEDSVWYVSLNCGKFSKSLTYRRKLLPTDWVAITDPEHVLRRGVDQTAFAKEDDEWVPIDASAGLKCNLDEYRYRCQWQHHPDNKPSASRSAFMARMRWARRRRMSRLCRRTAGGR